MSTHEDAKDPKDLKGSESMKPDPEFQDFFDKLVGTGARNARLFRTIRRGFDAAAGSRRVNFRTESLLCFGWILQVNSEIHLLVI